MPLYESTCNTTSQSFCCQLNRFSVNLTNSWRLQIFQSVLVLFCLFSIVFLVVKLKTTLEYRISVYYNFIVFACLTFVVVVLISLLPQPHSDDAVFYRIWTCVYIIVIGSQWFVQMALVIFMFQVDREKNSVRLTMFISGFLTIVFVCASIMGFLVAEWHPAKWLGIIIVEVIMSVGYFTTCLMHCRYCVWCLPRPPRPAVFGWSFFQTVAHALFAVEYILHLISSVETIEQCIFVLSNTLYYSLYALMLYKTILDDISYWRSAGALLNSFSTLDFTKFGPSKKNRIKSLIHHGIVMIRWDELKLRRFIGAGFHAEVFEAMWRGTKVAVKHLQIPPSSEEQQDILNDLIKECTILSKLRHPNIVLFLGLCSETPNFAIVTEFMSRGSLWNILHPSGTNQQASGHIVELPWSLRINILKDIAKGMNFLHCLNPPIIHRDLKSHNVLVDENWNCKVADFGMSRLKTLSHHMSRVGTPQWTAPEILREESYDEMADVWSFGVVCWELVTLEVPFVGISPLRVISMVAYQKAKLKLPTDCPPVLAQLMIDCWNDIPEQRPSFQIILERLNKIPQEEIATWPTRLQPLPNITESENNTNTINNEVLQLSSHNSS
jgi:tRNA A-37 threonylcarbamoyl transferase component Bud32